MQCGAPTYEIRMVMKKFASHCRLWVIGVCLALIFVLIHSNGEMGRQSARAAYDPPCDKPGWFPTDFGLKDHDVFWYNGYYYLVSIYIPPGNTDLLLQNKFAYARSVDFCEWEVLSPVLSNRTPGSWDDTAIWAPFVFKEESIYYLYYTGVTIDYTQSILLATSTNPSDPNSWQPQSMVFQPNHPGMIWEVGQPTDCRDPTVIKVGQVYYLYYAGRDTSGSIIGLATATSPRGPWTDWGSIVQPETDTILESPTIAQYGSAYYLFYNRSREGEYYRIGASPAGPWKLPIRFHTGWANEIWQTTDKEWFTSYLTDYTVTIASLSWDTLFDPPHPFTGSSIFRSHLPMVTNQ